MESTQLIKLFGLLEAAAGFTEGRSLADLASAVGLTKPTAHRILKTLVALGYMERCGNGIYRLTSQFRRLAAIDGDDRLIRIADEPMRELNRLTEETVNLGVLRYGRMVYLRVIESPQALRRIVNSNMTDPFSSTALGRAIVAFLPEERQEFLLRTVSFERKTPHTIVDPEALREVLRVTKANGYACEEEETDLGVMCLGAPIFDREGVVAGLSLTLPTVRASAERRPKLIEALRATADTISARLSEDSPPRR